MGYINLGNSLRYGPTGKKRKSYYKTKSLSTKKRSIFNLTSKSSYQESDRMKQIREHKEKYPSMMESGMIRGNTHKPDNSYKKETSEIIINRPPLARKRKTGTRPEKNPRFKK